MRTRKLVGCAVLAVGLVYLPAARAVAQDPDTTITFSVNAGSLSMSAPAAAVLGAGSPGTTIGPAPIGAVAVTDTRALLNGSWTDTASASDFTTGGGTPPETIPATDATYSPGTITTTGTVTATPTSITLSNSAQVVVTATGIVGTDSASWDPTLEVAVPASAVAGTYTATLTESVA